jgi:hypothetical protein
MKTLNILLISVIFPALVSFQTSKSSGLTNKSQQPGSDPGSITVSRCQDFTVTGDGKSDAWKNAEWVSLVKRGSDINGYETKARVLYSGTGIYFLFDCRDKKLTSTLKADNLNLWEEDVVEVFLWTTEDFPVYFEYEISPMDYELAIMVPNYKGKFLGWLPWNYGGDRRVIHATGVTGGSKISGGSVTGWTAEFFIPFKLLTPLPNVPPASGTKWRANMYRIDYDNGEAAFEWQKVNGTFHDYSNFGTFIFQ